MLFGLFMNQRKTKDVQKESFTGKRQTSINILQRQLRNFLNNLFQSQNLDKTLSEVERVLLILSVQLYLWKPKLAFDHLIPVNKLTSYARPNSATPAEVCLFPQSCLLKGSIYHKCRDEQSIFENISHSGGSNACYS